MHYRQDQLFGVPLKVRARRLFGHITEHDRVGAVKVTLVSGAGMELLSAKSGITCTGLWDEWIDLHMDMSHLAWNCRLRFEWKGIQRTVDIHDEHGFLQQGVCKVLLRGEAPSEEILCLDRAIKEVEEGGWKKIDWLDALSFPAIAQRQLEEAVARDQLFLLVEFAKLDARVRLRDDLQNIVHCDKVQRDCLLADNRIRPYSTYMPPPPEGLVIRPSPRSLSVLLKMQREPIVQSLPAFAPGLLWKYREWLAHEQKHERLICHFIRSVDWIDAEELALAKGCVERATIDAARVPLLTAVLSLALFNPHLAGFDDQLCMLLSRTIKSLSSEVETYIVCMFMRRVEGKQFKHLYAYLCEMIIEGAKSSIHGAMAVYWILEREDLVGREEWREMVGKQRLLIDCLQVVINDVRGGKESRAEKKRKLIATLRDPIDQCPPLLAPLLSPPVPLPTEPSVMVSGVIPDRTAVYKSTAMPVKISFLGHHDCQEHAVMIKTGESLDADLMVMRAIGIMDELWKAQGVDYCIQTYSVLPVCHQHGGWIQFVPSSSLSAILHDHGNSLTPYLVTAAHMQRYLFSCAGYSIITYVLGVGDRHLENLLLTPDGCLFHVDYAYLFGADPKPFPPPMKLCREMVEAMGGGVESEEFGRFKTLCLQAYQMVRRNAGLILDFLALHTDVVGEKALLFVRSRLSLEQSDADALERMERLIEESVHAMFPQVLETIHKWSQYWKS